MWTGRGEINDILHKSNLWDNKDCGRSECLMCKTALKEERKLGECKKRSIVYKIYCEEFDPLDGEKEVVIGENKDNEIENRALCSKRDYKYKYIEKTQKSGFERGKEHSDDRRNVMLEVVCSNISY